MVRIIRTTYGGGGEEEAGEEEWGHGTKDLCKANDRPGTVQKFARHARLKRLAV